MLWSNERRVNEGKNGEAVDNGVFNIVDQGPVPFNLSMTPFKRMLLPIRGQDYFTFLSRETNRYLPRDVESLCLTLVAVVSSISLASKINHVEI